MKALVLDLVIALIIFVEFLELIPALSEMIVLVKRKNMKYVKPSQVFRLVFVGLGMGGKTIDINAKVSNCNNIFNLIYTIILCLRLGFFLYSNTMIMLRLKYTNIWACACNISQKTIYYLTAKSLQIKTLQIVYDNFMI